MVTVDLPLADPADFRSTVRGRQTNLYTLASENLVTQITNYGGRIVSLFVCDRSGAPANMTLGFDRLDDYLVATERYYGAIVGRYANRIANGRFSLDDREVRLAVNDDPNHLHGGDVGFNDIVWDVDYADDRAVALSYHSPHLDEGYPGRCSVQVTYRINDEGALTIDYTATTESATIINLTNHAYFNLAGAGSGPIADHRVRIAADHYTPVDSSLIPTGEIAPVDETPMDLRVASRIGDGLNSNFEQIKIGGGYDHNFVLWSLDEIHDNQSARRSDMRLAATVEEVDSGRIMEVFTTEPGIQFYSGNFFDGSDIGSSGQQHRYREAFALETQHFPDSPNEPTFPSVILRPGEGFRSRTQYGFKLSME